jgi:hypothetical protein
LIKAIPPNFNHFLTKKFIEMKNLLVLALLFFGLTFTANAQWQDNGDATIDYQGKVGVGLQIDNSDNRFNVKGTMVIKSPANPSTKFIKLLYGSQNGFLDNIGGGRFDFRVDGTNVLSLTPGGFVGIGTNDPQNPLDVNGRIRSLEVKVVQTLGDFVFDNDYQLSTLEEEESFIQQNGHLKGFMSEESLNGELPLGEVTHLQQVKIEEMMLHLIDMNKRLTALEKENAELKARLAEK